MSARWNPPVSNPKSSQTNETAIAGSAILSAPWSLFNWCGRRHPASASTRGENAPELIGHKAAHFFGWLDTEWRNNEPFTFEPARGSVTEQVKSKRKARRRGARYVTIRGKRIKTTARGERIFRAMTRALKGVEVPPR